MKSTKALILSAALFFSFACARTAAHNEAMGPREYQIGSYLWYQTSGEFRALCYQAYNLARFKLDRDLEEKYNGKRALVFDIDETILDNSAGGAEEIKSHTDWDKKSLDRWVEAKRAIAIPGAVDFINYAQSKRVEVILISNRKNSQKDDTLENLKRAGFNIKKENLYFSEGEWSKEKRRQEVLKKYHVVLYFGDNLGDLHKDWDDKTSEERRALVDQHKDDFGEKFIVLPNPLYGDWEKSLPRNVLRENLLRTTP